MAKEGLFTMETSLNILKNLFKEEHIYFDKQYDEFVLALQKIRLAIKMDSCLMDEEDGRIVAAAILQH